MFTKKAFTFTLGAFVMLAISFMFSGCLRAIGYDGPDTGDGNDDANANTDIDTDPETDDGIDTDATTNDDTVVGEGADSRADSDGDLDTESRGCPGNFNPLLDCEKCLYPWQGDNCDICPENWDIASGCRSCVGNWSQLENCETCKGNWVDNGDDCGTCPGNWDAEQDCNECRNRWYGVDCENCPDKWDREKDCGECAGNWEGDSCSTCIGNWDSQEDCAVCLNHWIDEGNDCGTCPANWDSDADCNTCLGNWDIASNCETCLYPWVNDENNCNTCPGNWDATAGCSVCRGNWDSETACDSCLNGWIDDNDDCGTCPEHISGAECNVCQELWFGESCRVRRAERLFGSNLMWASDDTPLVVYVSFGAPASVYINKCSDLDCTETTTNFLFEDASVVSDILGVKGADGHPIIIYKSGSQANAIVMDCDDDLCETRSEQPLLMGDVDVWFLEEFILSRDGLPVLSGVEYETNDVRMVFCEDTLCNTFTTTVLPIADADANRWSLQMGRPLLDSEQNVLFTYATSLVRCNDQSCQDITITDISNISKIDAVIIGPDGFPMLLATNSSDELQLIDCEDVSCEQRTVATLRTGDIYPSTFIIGSNGFPFIAYREQHTEPDEYRLYFMQCDDFTCASHSIVTLETVPSKFSDFTLTLASDGTPVFSWNENIYYHCHTLTCR